MDKHAIIIQNIQDSVDLKNQVMQSDSLINRVREVSEKIIACYENNGKVLFCGNGGSAADSQHLAAELSGRYYFDRPPLPSEALHVNTSYLTAVANDYSYNEVYARLLKAIGNSGDILIGMSTSGNSRNIVAALKVGKEKGMVTVGFTGAGGGEMAEFCDVLIAIPSKDTPRIQECHMMLGHAVCQIVELSLFPQ